ncbi:hypothetical protein Tco_0838054 [Tanacetum coccineum]
MWSITENQITLRKDLKKSVEQKKQRTENKLKVSEVVRVVSNELWGDGYNPRSNSFGVEVGFGKKTLIEDSAFVLDQDEKGDVMRFWKDKSWAKKKMKVWGPEVCDWKVGRENGNGWKSVGREENERTKKRKKKTPLLRYNPVEGWKTLIEDSDVVGVVEEEPNKNVGRMRNWRASRHASGHNNMDTKLNGDTISQVSKDVADVLLNDKSEKLTDELIYDNMIDLMIPGEDSVP